MLINQQKQNLFLLGVSQYQNYNYQNATESFLSSMEQSLQGNHEFMVNHQQQSKDLHSLDQNNNISTNKYRLICGSYQTLLNLSCCWIKQNELNKSSTLCYRALHFNPYGSLAYYNLAIIHIRNGNYHQALCQMKCALSCEYLKQYQRTFDKTSLDIAIDLSPNNIQAIKYRIGMNANFLQLIKRISGNDGKNIKKEEESQVEITNQQSEVVAEDDNDMQCGEMEIINNELKCDIQSLKKYNRTYEVQFNSTTPNLFISTVKSQFILLSQHNTIINENGLKNKYHLTQLALFQQLKSKREQYLKIVQQNQSQLQISQIIDIQFTAEYDATLLKNIKMRTNKKLSKSQFQVTDCCQQVLQTSFELEDSCSIIKGVEEHQDNKINEQSHQDILNNQQTSQVFKRTNKTKAKSIDDKQNQQNQKENIMKINNTKNHLKESSLSNQNKLINPNPTVLTQNSLLVQSAISIQDYSQTHNNTINDTPQYNVNLIQSVLMPNTNQEQQQSSNSLFQIQQNARFQSFAQNRNKSSESIICSLLSPTRDLQRSQCNLKVNNSRMLQNKSCFKQLACSKCSVDHDNQQSLHRKKNVKMQINLTEIYNFDCNFTEIQSFCVIKHNGQELRTDVSKGKFPNWKEELKIYVDFDELNNVKNQDKNAEKGESSKVKIQLWAKPTHFKKDPYLNPNCMLQLIGEQLIDLREEKWVKRKIMLENNLDSQQRKKTAYMYISLQKIKPKKL